VAKHAEIKKVRLNITQIDGQDSLQVLCEVGAPESNGGLAELVAQSVRSVLHVRGDVVLQVIGSLPNDGKVIDDQRSY